MARKKRTIVGENDASRGVDTDAVRISKLFLRMQEKGTVWLDRERKASATIERFQTAVVALRDAQAAALRTDAREKDAVVLQGLGKNVEIDPWVAEDLLQQVQELSRGFEELLDEMYRLQEQARDMVVHGRDDVEHVISTTLRPVDYYQMLNQELATFEAEYQHIEILLRRISFQSTTEELRTLVIFWSTSPFLDPVQTHAFRQRHDLSQQYNT